MSYGLVAYNDSGQAITSPSVLASLYAGTVTCNISAGSQSFDFPNVPAGHLYALQNAGGSKLAGGTHDWVIESHNGHARITFTFVELLYRSSTSTTLTLFATNTFEPDYGINATNDYGERTVSTIFPACKFIQKMTLSSVLHDYDGSYGTSPKYTLYTNETAGATGILFWSLPSSTDTSIWWSGNTNVASGFTGRMHLYTTASSAPPVLPEAFLFQPGPMTVSTSWGLRVFDGAGQVMFDGATESLKIESRITGVQYNLSTENSYTLPSGFTPAMYFPGYYSETKTGGCTDGYAGIRRQRGMMRRNGTSLITLIRIMDSEPDAWDCRRNESVRKYEWGMSTNLFVPVINANRYGGASI